MRQMLVILLLSLTGSIAYSGCAHTIVLHPVTDQDIRMLQDGNKQWVCMSPEYVQQVMKARLGK